VKSLSSPLAGMSQAAFQTDETLAALESAQAAGRLSASAVENVRIWLTKPQYSQYVPLICQHLASGKWADLEDVFWTSIPFGTAGRRGRMYPIGTNAINDRTMGESAQGLADYVLSVVRSPLSVAKKSPAKTTDHGPRTTDLRCAISYDTRHQSRHFAELCAGIMVANGFNVLMFDGFRPTPELSFTVRDKKCACGMMISASHNPPSDNAIKAFWSTGGQLRPPHDEGVIECVARVVEIKQVPFADAVASGSVRFCQEEIDPRYKQAVLEQSQAGPRDLRVLYSPLHGVGLTSILPVLKTDGFEQIEVYQPHAAPDGDFPNVPGNVANPENPTVFDQLIEHARRSGAELVLASDPDADRIGCAAPLSVAKPQSGDAAAAEWRTLSGNQIGVLLGDLLLRRLQDSDRLTPEHYVIKTLVTGDMICAVARQLGARAFGDVLTGFKWIGSLIDEVGPDKFVFGFEEAHGYLAGTYARDKDGAVAAMLLAELAAQCKAKGQTLHEQLDQLFLRYGCYQEKTVSHTMPGADGVARMQAMMTRLRASPPQRLGGLPVTSIRDYLSQRVFNCALANDVPMTASIPPSDLLIFDLSPPGNGAAIRASGTEPKIKFYLFASEPPNSSRPEADNLKELIAVKQRLNQRLDALKADLIAAAR
jgi:phosphoglucomutase/phosphomannomutase